MRNKVAPASDIPGEECEPKPSYLWCARSKQAPSLREARHTQWSEWDSGCWDLTLAHWHHCHDIPPCIPHPYTVLIISPWLLKRLQRYYLGCAEILEKDTLVTNYVTSSTTLLEHSLALCLPSAPIQGGKCPLKDRKLAQRLNHTTEFSEGICKQIMELKLDLQSSKLATRPFSFQQTHLPAFTCAACSESLVAQQKNNQVRAKSPGRRGLRKQIHQQGYQYPLCTQHCTGVDLLCTEPCSSTYNCRRLPSQGCSSQML